MADKTLGEVIRDARIAKDGMKLRELARLLEVTPSYVSDIENDRRVRVKVGRRWHTGTAYILPDDDPLERLRWLRRPANDLLLRAVGTEQLTVRIDLDD